VTLKCRAHFLEPEKSGFLCQVHNSRLGDAATVRYRWQSSERGYVRVIEQKAKGSLLLDAERVLSTGNLFLQLLNGGHARSSQRE
jgi:hypothetical protein